MSHKPCRINKLHTRRTFLNCKLNLPFLRILPISKQRSSHSHLKSFIFSPFSKVSLLHLFSVLKIMLPKFASMNASVAPVMMSLHLWHFDKQLFKDCSLLPRHHTLLINKPRQQYFWKITRGDYKFRITIAIFSIPATISVTRFLLTILIVVSRNYFNLSQFLYPDRDRCTAMFLSLPWLLYCNIISLSRSRLLYRGFCITIVPIAVSRSLSRSLYHDSSITRSQLLYLSRL